MSRIKYTGVVDDIHDETLHHHVTYPKHPSRSIAYTAKIKSIFLDKSGTFLIQIQQEQKTHAQRTKEEHIMTCDLGSTN
jgi:hypothetical protein